MLLVLPLTLCGLTAITRSEVRSPWPQGVSCSCISCCPTGFRSHGEAGHRTISVRSFRQETHRIFYMSYGCNTENRLKYSFQSVFNAVPALHFRDDKVSIAKICLVPITVSQLKCALHILIGDWYKYSNSRDGIHRFCCFK